jgi:hypothetical protein
MKAKLFGQYKKEGRPMYIYAVDCTPAEKAQIKAAKGDNYKEVPTHDERTGAANPASFVGKPMLWVRTRHIEDSDVRITNEGGVFIDNSVVDDIQSLIGKYPEGSAMNRALAAKGADFLFDQLVGGKRAVATAVVPVAAPAEQSSDLSETK